MEQVIVVRPFGPWRVGDVIKDAEDLKGVMGSEHADHVVRVQLPKEG